MTKLFRRYFFLILEKNKKYFAMCLKKTKKKKQLSSIRKHSGNREVSVFLNVPVFVIC